MADEHDDTERTEDPTQKRLDEALERGDVVKSQEVNTWFVIAGGDADAAGVLRLDERRPDHDVPRAASPTRYQIPVDGRGLIAIAGQARASRCWRRSRCRSLLLVLAALAGNVIQHRLVWSADPLKPKFSKISPLAGFKRLFSKQALANFAKGLVKLAVVGAVMVALLWPQRYRLEGAGRDRYPSACCCSPARCRSKLLGAVVAILRAGRRRRLPVPVPAMVRAAEDVAARDEGGVQADRRRSGDQGQDPAVAPGPDAQAHDGGGAEGLGGHHQPDPLRHRPAIRARHEGAGLPRQGRRRCGAEDPRGRRRALASRSSRTRRSPARCTPPSRSTRKSRPSTTRRWPKSSATS